MANITKINEVSQGPPTWYLGEDMEKIQTTDGHEIWSTSSRSHITNSIDTIESLLPEDGKCEVLKYNVRNQFPLNYRSDLDVTEELRTELLSCYFQLLGILR